jgi:ligand-binding sensor protein
MSMDLNDFENVADERYEKNIAVLSDFPSFEHLRKILEDFSKLGNISIVAVDHKSVPITKRLALNIFCSKMCHSPLFGEVCSKVHEIAIEESKAIKDRFTYRCPFDLLESVIPIFTQNEYIGAVICGQAKCENVPAGFVDMSKSQIVSTPQKLEIDSVLNFLYDSIPVMDYGYFDSLISIINEVALSMIVSGHKKITTVGDGKLELLKSAKRPYHLSGGKKTGLNLYFLLNSINSLANLSVLHGSEKINNLSILLARYVKNTINKFNKKFCHLEEEKETILNYLHIQKVRFGELLNFAVNLPINIKDYLIPVDVLLPFIERIFILSPSSDSSKFQISVVFKKEGNNIVIEVTDNLSSSSSLADEMLKTSYSHDSEIKVIENGIITSTDRLLSVYGNGANVSIKAKENGGGRCVIRYPAMIRETDNS